MSYFVRKISRAKWSYENITDNPFDVPADAISLDLKTKDNTLSVWEVTDESAVDNAVLAIASGFNSIEAFDIVWVNKAEMEQKGIKCIQSPGITPVQNLIDTHFDLASLNYYHIGLIAESINDTINRTKIKRYSKGEIKKLLISAVNNGSLDKDELQEKVRVEILK